MKKFYSTLSFIGCICILQAQPGTLNKSFGSGGVVETIASGNTYTNFFTNATRSFTLANGKTLTLVEGTYFVVVNRRLASGAIDSSYGNNGFSPAVNMLQSSGVLQPDGKMVVVGETNSGNSDFIIARFNSDGTLDNTFGSTAPGITVTDAGSDGDLLSSVALQADGKIVAGGQTYRNGTSQFALIRYSSVGVPDNSFGQQGLVITNFGNTCSISSVAIQSDNKILAAGNFNNGTGNFAVARYLSTGTLDTSYNHTGEVTSNFGNSDNAVDAILQSNGRLLVGGYYIDPSFNSHMEIARYSSNGALDTSFNGTGVTGTSFGYNQEYFASMAITSNTGAIVMGGYCNVYQQYPQNPELALARFNANGTLDNSFGANGHELDPVGANYLNFMSCLTLDNGKILASGYSQVGNSFQYALTRFNTNGNPDSSFGSGGTILGIIPGAGIGYNLPMLQQDGKFVVQGSTDTIPYFLARFDQKGKLDQSYGNKGFLSTAGTIYAMQPDNKVLESNGYPGIVMTRYNTNSTLDKTYGVQGTANLDFFNGIELPTVIAVQSNNKSIVAGYINNDVGTDMLLARINADGTPDLSFGNGGAVIQDYEQQDYPFEVTIQNDGKIIVAGTGYMTTGQLLTFVSRFKSNGLLDSTFAQNGTMLLSPGLSWTIPSSVVLQNDGKILLGYQYSNDNITYVSLVARYKSNGLPDSSFGVNGSVITIGGPDLYLQSDQKIIAQGYGPNAANYTVLLIARLKSNGSVDSSWGSNGLTSGEFLPGNNYFNYGVISGSNILFVGSVSDPITVGILAEYQLGPMASIASPASVIVPTDQGVCEAVVNHIDPIAGANEETVFQMNGATVKSGSGTASGETFNKGETIVTYRLASDSAVSSSFTVTVEDLEPPEIGSIAKNAKLVETDNRLIDLQLGYGVSDNCGTTTTLLSIRKEGDDNTDADHWQIVSDHHAQLSLSTNPAKSHGGVYRLLVQATDLAGNNSIKEDTVIISDNLIGASMDLEISALPNPSRDQFSLHVNSNRQRPVMLELFSSIGLRVRAFSPIMPGETIQFGQSLVPGVYYLKATQDELIKVTKIVKM